MRDFNINGENSVENDTDMKNEVGVFYLGISEQ
jgi:hypothetical protein